MNSAHSQCSQVLMNYVGTKLNDFNKCVKTERMKQKNKRQSKRNEILKDGEIKVRLWRMMPSSQLP